MVKSETRRNAEILAKNASARLLGRKFCDSRKVKQTMQKRDFETYQKHLQDFEILHVFRKEWKLFLLFGGSCTYNRCK